MSLEKRLLSSNPFNSQSQPQSFLAYKKCEQLEAIEESNEEALVHARVLGFFLLEAPTNVGLSMMSDQIDQCMDNVEKLRMPVAIR